MPQISLYVDKETLNKIEKAAERENISISRWVGKHLRKVIQGDYPPGYFELFGSIADDTFTSPQKSSFKDDSKREQL